VRVGVCPWLSVCIFMVCEPLQFGNNLFTTTSCVCVLCYVCFATAAAARPGEEAPPLPTGHQPQGQSTSSNWDCLSEFFQPTEATSSSEEEEARKKEEEQRDAAAAARTGGEDEATSFSEEQAARKKEEEQRDAAAAAATGEEEATSFSEEEEARKKEEEEQRDAAAAAATGEEANKAAPKKRKAGKRAPRAAPRAATTTASKRAENAARRLKTKRATPTEKSQEDDGTKNAAKRTKLASSSLGIIQAKLLPISALLCSRTPHRLVMFSAGGGGCEGIFASVAMALNGGGEGDSPPVPVIAVDGLGVTDSHHGSSTVRGENIKLENIKLMLRIGMVVRITPNLLGAAKKKQKKSDKVSLKEEEYVVCGVVLMTKKKAVGGGDGRVKAEVVLTPLECDPGQVNIHICMIAASSHRAYVVITTDLHLCRTAIVILIYASLQPLIWFTVARRNLRCKTKLRSKDPTFQSPSLVVVVVKICCWGAIQR
jgi:hypothetical protein